jgi:3',5'-cyclic AMP phosphodiesterase CpdA
MANRLSTAVQQVLALPQLPHQVLVAGDCAHLSGQARDYQEYIRRIRPLAAGGLPMHMTMGNHDHRERFWEALPGEVADANAALGRQAMILPGRHANWFLLDSLNKTNVGGGELGGDQLEWLAAELDARADKPALVMLHHDPDRSLSDSDKLLAITRPRRQVKALFYGHTHVWEVKRDHSGMHMVNLPATGYTLFWRSFIGWVDCQVHPFGATLRVHTLDPDEKENGQIVHLNWRAA